MGENVRGLFEHDNGRTLQTITDVIAELGYTLIEPRVLRAIQYDVPQKRERLILIAIRNDIAPLVDFKWPDVCTSVRTLRDAFSQANCSTPMFQSQKGKDTRTLNDRVMRTCP